MTDPRTIGELIAWLEAQGNISGSPGVDGLAEGYKDAAAHLRRIAYGEECGHPGIPDRMGDNSNDCVDPDCPGTTSGLVERVNHPTGLVDDLIADAAWVAALRTELAIPEEKP